MPVTVTAKRALRSSKRKQVVNKTLMTRLDIAMRKAKKSPTKASVSEVMRLADRASKKRIIHANKAARIKSRFTSLISKKKSK